MLVLSRKTNETIRIGNEVVVTVLKTKGNSVRLGIVAPNDVRVMRGELLHADASSETMEQDDDEEAKSESGADKIVVTMGQPDVGPSGCPSLPASSRCSLSTPQNHSDEGRCAADYEGDRWNVSSMQRRVRRACTQLRQHDSLADGASGSV